MECGFGRVQVFSDCINDLGEGLYITSDRVFWLDINSKQLYMKKRNSPLFCYQLIEQASVIFSVIDDVVFLASESGICSFNLVSEEWNLVSQLPKELNTKRIRTNDGCILDKNKFFFGTMEKKPTGKNGALYIFDGKKIRRIFDGVGIPNSFIRINNLEYLVSDSFEKKVFKFTFDDSISRIVNKQLWLDLATEDYTPDGGVMDRSGCIYLAMWDGFSIHKYDLNANLIEQINVPVPRPTNCKFFNEDVLLVTSAREGLSQDALELYPYSGSVLELKMAK